MSTTQEEEVVPSPDRSHDVTADDHASSAGASSQWVSIQTPRQFRMVSLRGMTASGQSVAAETVKSESDSSGSRKRQSPSPATPRTSRRKENEQLLKSKELEIKDLRRQRETALSQSRLRTPQSGPGCTTRPNIIIPFPHSRISVL